MTLKSINCKGIVVNDGELEITNKGFCYSHTNNYPTLSDSSVWVVSEDLLEDGTFNAVITGLTEATLYYVNSYAINSLGTDYSNTSMSVTTNGLSTYPVITIGITHNGLYKNIYEIGTTNMVVVTGDTTRNDETVFNNGWINQTSNPQPLNPIRSWSGWLEKYNTSYPPQTLINFSPVDINELSWSMTQESFYNCGNSPYIISASITIEAIFPFLWVLKNQIMPAGSYFNPNSPVGNNYFYYESSYINLSYYNGKKIQKKPLPYEELEFLVTPSSTYKFFQLGFSSSYGDKIQYKDWATNAWIPAGGQYSNFLQTTVNTNSYPGIDWSYSYNIFRYMFTVYSASPRQFFIRFTE